jgi:hypothetical protein
VLSKWLIGLKLFAAARSRKRMKGQTGFGQNHKTNNTTPTETATHTSAFMNAILIPILAIVMGLSIPLVAILTDYAKRRKFYELHHRERLAAIEKGIELPPLPPEFGGGSPRSPRYFLKGLVWFLIGLALIVALGVNEGWDTALFGLIPTAIGAAYLIYYLVEGKKLEEEARKAETPGPLTV